MANGGVGAGIGYCPGRALALVSTSTKVPLSYDMDTALECGGSEVGRRRYDGVK